MQLSADKRLASRQTTEQSKVERERERVSQSVSEPGADEVSRSLAAADKEWPLSPLVVSQIHLTAAAAAHLPCLARQPSSSLALF